MPFAHITGTGSAVPKRILSNKDLESIVETTDEWITRRTGIRERRIASSNTQENTTHLAHVAATRAMEMAGVSSEAIDLIVVGTVTPDRQFPSAGCMVQKELNAVNAAAFDISAGCSGFLYALNSAYQSIALGNARTALVIGSERLSSILNWQDRSTCVLLGDGAGAVVLQAKEEPGGLMSTHLKSDGSYWNLLYSENGNTFIPDTLDNLDLKPFQLFMDGNRLFKQAVGCLASIAQEALTHNDLAVEDVQLVIPHQANMRIIKAVAEKLKIPMEQVFTNVHKYGNTSSASIPIAIDEAHRAGRMAPNDAVLLMAFGAGLTWGSALLKWAI